MSRERYSLSIAVFVLLRKGDEICMLKRSGTGWMDGQYSLPAGGLEKGETLSIAAVRELWEETGVLISSENLEHAHTMHVWTDDRSWIGHFFSCNVWTGSPILAEPDKHSEVAWKSRNQLPEDTVPYVRKAIEAINRQQSYSEYGWEFCSYLT